MFYKRQPAYEMNFVARQKRGIQQWVSNEYKTMEEEQRKKALQEENEQRFESRSRKMRTPSRQNPGSISLF